MNHRRFCLALSEPLVASILLISGLAGCADQKYRSLDGAPDGRAEVLAVDSEQPADLLHATGRFLELVQQPDRVVLVDFWGPHCGPCLHLAPELEEIARKYPDQVSVVKVDVESAENAELARFFEIHAIPEMRLFVNGQTVGAIHGYVSAKRIAQNVEQAISLLPVDSGA